MRILGVFAPLLLLTISVSCSNTANSSSSKETQKPCAQCVDGVTTVRKNVERRVFCVVNGRQVDCAKNPPECPKCAQMNR